MPGVEMPNTVCVRPSAGICPLALGVLWRSCRAHGVLGMISTSGPLTALLSELRAYCTPLPLPKLSAGRDARGAQRCSGGGGRFHSGHHAMAISPAPLCPGDRTVSCIPGDPSQPRFVCPQPVLSPSAALWWAHTYLNDGAALTQAGGESLWQESPSAAAPGSRHLRAVNTIPASHEGSGRRGGGTGDGRGTCVTWGATASKGEWEETDEIGEGGGGSLKNSALYYKLWKRFLSEYKYKYVQSFI